MAGFNHGHIGTTSLKRIAEDRFCAQQLQSKFATDARDSMYISDFRVK